MYKRSLSLLLTMILMISMVLPGSAAALYGEGHVVGGNTSAMSMRPLEEENCYLYLSSYSKEQLARLTIDDILSELQDYDGNSVPIEKSATTVWRYVLDESDHIEMYKEYTIGSGEIFGLTYPEGATAIQLEMIVGSNGQLNAKNKRYIVKAYLVDIFELDLDVEIYLQAEDGTRSQAIPDDCKEWNFKFSDGETEETVFDLTYGGTVTGSLEDYGSVWLNVTSELVEDPRVEIVVYPVVVFEDGYGTIMRPITEQILNQDMSISGSGYQISGQKNTDSTYQIRVYVNGEEYSRRYFSVRYWNWYPCHEGNLYSKESGQTNVFASVTSEFDSITDVSNIVFELNSGLSSHDEYYFDYDFVMRMNFGEMSDDNYDGMVEKIVVGHFDTKEAAEAAGAKDVTWEVLREGYLANYGGKGVDFTVFKFWRLSESFHLPYDTLADKINVKVVENSDTWREYTDAPIVGQQDPWFRVTGAKDAEGSTLDTYVVENGDTINMDTSYGYGNQCIFINGNVDLKNLQPVIWRADRDRITLYVNGEPYEEGDFIDCTETVTFTAIIDGHQKTYNVSFKEKLPQSDLYVFGPSTREVHLDEYFEEKHDILIANMGDEALHGLRVELNATNCQLDEYWTIGGEGNNTLAPFTETSFETEFGELDNLAKIRLIPVEEENMVEDGEIAGTLTIYADGQEPVVVNLTGQAQNPQITTNQERFESYKAVKWVPYGYVITTSNMHDWIDTSFKLTGDLPEGLTFNPDTGEIYGVPQEIGEFNIMVEAFFESETSGFDSSTVNLKLTVLDNTNENVYKASDEGYGIKQHIGTQEGDYDFVLVEGQDFEFTSHGDVGDFVALWVNGKKLAEEYYDTTEGSTKNTSKSQTIKGQLNQDGHPNTISQEFKDKEGNTKRAAQTVVYRSAVVQKLIDDASYHLKYPDKVTLKDKEKVDELCAVYDSLTVQQKKQVLDKTIERLTTAKTTIVELESKATAKIVDDLIAALPDNVTLADKDTVVSVRAKYNALSEVQKKYVTNYSKLTTAEAKIADLEKQEEQNESTLNTVTALIEKIPLVVTLADKETVSAARKAYDELTSAQQCLIGNYKRLQIAEKTIADLEAEAMRDKATAKAVDDLIAALPDNVTLADKHTVAEARAAYDALTSAQKELVTNYKTLEDAEGVLANLEGQTPDDGKCAHPKQIKLHGIAANCEDTGLTEGLKCDGCGMVLKKQEIIPALGHDWDNGNISGGQKYLESLIVYKCTRCGETKSEANSTFHRHISDGYPDGTFRPDGNITRAEVAALFYAMLNDHWQIDNSEYEFAGRFTDVSENDWFVKQVEIMASLGLTSGYPDGTFKPYAPITRAEFATMAVAMAQLEIDGVEKFPDVEKNDWFYDYVRTAAYNGLITGYPNGDFRPKANITRAESTVVASRMLGRTEIEAKEYFNHYMAMGKLPQCTPSADGSVASWKELRVLSDVEGHWAYYWLMIATNDHYHIFVDKSIMTIMK